ncbi:hypothetical protein CPB97_006590, partial [Podila verticillata]
ALMFKEVQKEVVQSLKPAAQEVGRIKSAPANTTSAQVKVSLFGHELFAIADTGAAPSVVTRGLIDYLGIEADLPYDQMLITADGKRHHALGMISSLPIRLDGVVLQAPAVIMDRPDKVLILGMTWMKLHGVQLNLKDNSLHFAKQGMQHQAPLKTSRDTPRAVQYAAAESRAVADAYADT